jgi:hypothetical protein
MRHHEAVLTRAAWPSAVPCTHLIQLNWTLPRYWAKHWPFTLLNPGFFSLPPHMGHGTEDAIGLHRAKCQVALTRLTETDMEQARDEADYRHHQAVQA